MKKAVMIGAGNIGRGFIGMLLSQAGYHVVFADIDMAVIEDIKARGEYTVHLVDDEPLDTVVRGISAMSSLSPQLAEEIASCQLVCTSVGLSALAKVAPAIAAGIARRCELDAREPLNVIACENAIRGSSLLKTHVAGRLDEGQTAYMERYVGFPDCAVDRIIPPGRSGLPADVVVERYCEWDVEKGGFIGPLPQVPGMELVEDLTAYLERKLFTLNGPNAVTACYGYLKGYPTIGEALEDPDIYELVWGMMEECGAMLEKRHGFSAASMESYRRALMRRFKNPYIIDDVIRVAREPLRKLSPNDRIIAPMQHALSLGLDPRHYYTGAAAVLLYDNPADAQCVQMRMMIEALGVPAALEQISGVKAGSHASIQIEREYHRLRQEGRINHDS